MDELLTQVKLEDGSVFKLGCIEDNPYATKAFPVYGEVSNTPIVPRSKWKELIDRMGGGPESGYLSYVHNQNGYGMCNASATASAMESQRIKQGLPLVRLSAGDLYYRISGGRDNGSTLQDGIRSATKDGVARESLVPYLEWRRTTAEAREDRKNFRVLEAFLCPTFDACMSAVLMGFDLISGIWWYDNYTPTSDGWLPAPRGSRGGHAVHGYKPTYKGDRFGIWHKNSWTPKWGLNGFCVFPEEVYVGGNTFGWWAVRSIVDEGGIIPNG
jgi:hypothetical protein